MLALYELMKTMMSDFASYQSTSVNPELEFITKIARSNDDSGRDVKPKPMDLISKSDNTMPDEEISSLSLSCEDVALLFDEHAVERVRLHCEDE